MEEVLSPSERAQRADQIQQFLDHPGIQASLGLLEREYYEEFLAAANDEARRNAWAKARCLRDFPNSVARIVADGEHAKVEIKASEVPAQSELPLA